MFGRSFDGEEISGSSSINYYADEIVYIYL